MRNMNRVFEKMQRINFDLDYSSLSNEQSTVLDNILTAIADGEKKIILKGSAGVGKTYLVNYLIHSIYNDTSLRKGGIAYITAPTNRAVAVLENRSDDNPNWMNFSTIHKALYMKRVIDNKTGEIYFKPDYRPKYESPFRNGFVIVIDEGSMLNSEILFYLEDHEYEHIPMIFLGDIKQLNPVKEKDSPIFQRPQMEGQEVKIINVDEKVESHIVPKYVEFELNEIVRQSKNNPIIQLSNNLPHIGLLEDKLLEDGTGYSYTSDYEDIVDKVAFNEEHRFLAWTNVTVDSFNLKAREKIFYNPSKIEKDEIIIFAHPYEGITKNYTNNAEIRVQKVDIREHNFTAVKKFIPQTLPDPVTIEGKLKYYLINDEIKVIHESSEFQLKNILSKIKGLTKDGLSWKAWFDFAEQFAKFGYRYATTVHKAQGGTFDTVYIHMKDVNRNRNVIERKRLWYTAVTRAAKNVVFYNEKRY